MEAVVAKRVSGQGHVPGIHRVEVPQERRRTHALPAGERDAGEVFCHRILSSLRPNDGSRLQGGMSAAASMELEIGGEVPAASCRYICS